MTEEFQRGFISGLAALGISFGGENSSGTIDYNKLINTPLFLNNDEVKISDKYKNFFDSLKNANTLNGFSDKDFVRNLYSWEEGDIKQLVLDSPSGFVYIKNTITGMPLDNKYWFGTINSNASHKIINVYDFDGEYVGYNIYHSGNDEWTGWISSGSGGDADTVDGLHANQLGGLTSQSRISIEDNFSDFDEIIEEGYYKSNYFYPNEHLYPLPNNAPFDIGAFYLDVYKISNTDFLQKAFTVDGEMPREKRRWYHNGSWSSWISLSDRGNARTVDNYPLSVIKTFPLSYQYRSLISKDLNEYIGSSYLYSTGEETFDNSPFEEGGYFLDVYNFPKTVLQIAFKVTADQILEKRRSYDLETSSWSDWIALGNNGNADTVDGLHAEDFLQGVSIWNNNSIENLVLNETNSKAIYISNTVSNMPIDNSYWFGFVWVVASYRCIMVFNLYDNFYAGYKIYNSSTKTWTNWQNISNGLRSTQYKALDSGTDLNNIKDSGLYCVSGKQLPQTIVNSPFSNIDYYLWTLVYSSSRINQFAMSLNGVIKRRLYNDSSWSKWTILGEENIPQASSTLLGGVKIGDGLEISNDGVLTIDKNILLNLRATNNLNIVSSIEIAKEQPTIILNTMEESK